MLYTNNSEKLVGLQELNVKYFEDIDGKMVLSAEMNKWEQVCPCCGEIIDIVHD